MRIEELNALDAPAAADALRQCARIESWVEGLVAQRPYADRAALLDAARTAAAGWTPQEVEAALADHPRIGERTAGMSAHSRAEQAGVPDDEAVRERLREGNRRYEERFGRIYLVRAAGRSAEEMLALLEERLDNDPATELAVTGAELAQIALLRLEGLIE